MEIYSLKIVYITLNPEVRDDLVHTEIIYGKWDAEHFAELVTQATNVRNVEVTDCLTGEIIFFSENGVRHW